MEHNSNVTRVTDHVTTATGAVRGLQHQRHQSYLGIRYARAPIGPLRFAAPQEPESWTSVRDVVAFAPSCPQPSNHAVMGFAASGARDEDCLFLNVYTPRADTARRPVMLWVHGGGFTHGTGSESIYDGEMLAVRGDVVVVSIHYRLGALGYLYLGAHGGDDWQAESNIGQLDQIAALRWVQQNIAAFGGDPGCVTIFGESAGAVAVTALMAMPAARGLFRRVIAQSGTATRLANRDSAAAATALFLAKLGVERADAAHLRELPVDQIVDAQIAAQNRCFPICEVDNLPRRLLDCVHDGQTRDIELIVGTNRDEVKLFVPRDREPIDDAQLQQQVTSVLPRRASERAGEVVETYRRSRRQHDLSTENLDLLDAIRGDAQFRTSARRLAVAQQAQQPNSYLYLFTWESPARGGTLGSCHALDIPFVFGSIDQPLQRRFAGTGPEATALSQHMMDAWIAFAKTGDPSHSGIGPWPAHDRSRHSTMVFGRDSAAVDAPFSAEAAIWDSLLG